MRGLILGFSFERQLIVGAAMGAAVAVATPAAAQTRSFDVAEQPASRGIPAFAKQAGIQILASGDLVTGKRTRQVKGRYSVEEGLRLLLEGSGLTARFNGSGQIVTIQAAPRVTASSTDGEPLIESEDIIVTGSRIRGGVVASKKTVQTQEEMRQAGYGTLAEAIQAIPQNFGGGQNPGVGFNVPEGQGVGYGAASSINLRGLGSDATLTLLNGRRLAYNFAFQAVDVSQIPFEAIDRIEVVPDGSSALYGSDAVGGVANILLKKDYDGVRATARLGASTDGGNAQQQYSAVAGSRWDRGGLLVAGEYGRTTAILARERSYAAERAPGLFLSPFVTHHNLLASAHQALGETLTFSIDGLYNKRKSRTQYAFDDRGDPEIYGSHVRAGTKSYVIAPSLNWEIPGGDWQAELSGMIGSDRTTYGFQTFFNGANIGEQAGCYCNDARSVDLALDGPLFALPGGQAKLAIGAGYRVNKFRGYRTSGGSQDIRASQDAYFAYGELALPLAGPAQAISGLYRLDVTGALRYERYPGIDNVVTPKLGLVYAPSADLDLRGTWGRSFRAPTLYQQFNQVFANVYLTPTLGGSGYPADATAIYLTGGNRDLKPERATTWSTTLDLHPSVIDGLRIELSYFNVKYRDRIVAPIQYGSQSLSNPLYADYVVFSPTRGDVDAVVASADVFTNVAGGTFDPDRVAAIVYNRNVNVARQALQGVDVAAQYRIETTDAGTFNVKVDASHLDSEQVVTALQPVTQLSGTLFNPPKVRGRAGVVWAKDGLGLGVFANYTGKIRDTRSPSGPVLGSTTTFDASLRLTTPTSSDVFGGVDLVLGVQNLFNAKPPLLETSYVYDAPYDSTNYSAVGRFVSFSLSKAW